MRWSRLDTDATSVLPEAPEELTSGRLKRLGEGIGKVVYASPHWVVKRNRSPSEILALIALWKIVRRAERLLPGRLGARLLNAPSIQIRFLRVALQAVLLPFPKGFWYVSHLREVLHVYASRSDKGETLARQHLLGTRLIPEHITFPPVRVQVGGWPGWLTVSEATERVESTLLRRLEELASEGDYVSVEQWLDRCLQLRQAGWQMGLFSVDAHLKNFGIIGERVVLIDPGGLTDAWDEIEARLAFEQSADAPHVRLGLQRVFAGKPQMADRFDARWRETVSIEGVLRHWPANNGSNGRSEPR